MWIFRKFTLTICHIQGLLTHFFINHYLEFVEAEFMGCLNVKLMLSEETDRVFRNSRRKEKIRFCKIIGWDLSVLHITGSYTLNYMSFSPLSFSPLFFLKTSVECVLNVFTFLNHYFFLVIFLFCELISSLRELCEGNLRTSNSDSFTRYMTLWVWLSLII